jgi:hypothetical protein
VSKELLDGDQWLSLYGYEPPPRYGTDGETKG